MSFFILLVLLAIAYLVWRISDQLPDIVFRISEVQRDVAELRRNVGSPASTPGVTLSPDMPVSTSAAQERVPQDPAAQDRTI